jgi:hypothetical protein
VQQVAAAMYSASTVDRDTTDCFLLDQLTIHPPRKNVAPLVLLLSSTEPAQLTSVKAYKSSWLPIGYYKPYSVVPLRYLKILLTASR